jgi:predicted GNAT family acetyltransferase
MLTDAQTRDSDRLQVVDVPAAGRYELTLDGDRVGWADYGLSGGVATIPHVETVPAHRGKDFAARLMAGVLDDVRARNLRVRPICPYASAYMRRRPETHDLIAET